MDSARGSPGAVARLCPPHSHNPAVTTRCHQIDKVLRFGRGPRVTGLILRAGLVPVMFAGQVGLHVVSNHTAPSRNIVTKMITSFRGMHDGLATTSWTRSSPPAPAAATRFHRGQAVATQKRVPVQDRAGKRARIIHVRHCGASTSVQPAASFRRTYHRGILLVPKVAHTLSFRNLERDKANAQFVNKARQSR